jgi:hypothetical protein
MKWYVLPGRSPVRTSRCAVTSDTSIGDRLTSPALVPNSTTDVLGTLVIQATVTLVRVMLLAKTPSIAGGTGAGPTVDVAVAVGVGVRTMVGLAAAVAVVKAAGVVVRVGVRMMVGDAVGADVSVALGLAKTVAVGVLDADCATVAVAVGSVRVGVEVDGGTAVAVRVAVAVDVGIIVAVDAGGCVGVGLTCWASLIFSGSVLTLAMTSTTNAHTRIRRPTTAPAGCHCALWRVYRLVPRNASGGSVGS